MNLNETIFKKNEIIEKLKVEKDQATKRKEDYKKDVTHQRKKFTEQKEIIDNVYGND